MSNLANVENIPKKNPSKLIVSLLVLIFVVPVITAHILYRCRDYITFTTVAKGTLLSPPLSTKSFTSFDPTYLGQWQLVYLSAVEKGNATNFEDHNKISTLSQIHNAIGKDKKRVSYRTVPATDLPITLQEHFAIIDPQGWLIMQYPSKTNPQGILQDIKRLLRVSHAG